MKKLTTRQIYAKNNQRISPLRDHTILWLHNIRSMHNVGAAFRSADAFGIKSLCLSGYTPKPPRAEITKTALGAEEHVSWEYIDDWEAEINRLKEAGYTVAGLEQTDHSLLMNDWSPPSKKICLILGNEVTGIDSDLISMLDVAIEIPQFGMKHSLNVSVACGIGLYALFEKLS
ncbi:RNA methyltransferase [Pleurocapsales cyanobacterium LEGE 10410]|nr:RNA methyltransferase [Pleurocapsales cyanobacterium LEGE 10410]